MALGHIRSYPARIVLPVVLKAGILYPSILLSLDILSQDSDGANYLGYVIPILPTILDMRYCHATILSIFRSLGSVVVVCTLILLKSKALRLKSIYVLRLWVNLDHSSMPV